MIDINIKFIVYKLSIGNTYSKVIIVIASADNCVMSHLYHLCVCVCEFKSILLATLRLSLC